MQIYDYAVLQPIIEMSGGIIANWQGNDLNLRSDVDILACGDKEIHEKAIEILNSWSLIIEP